MSATDRIRSEQILAGMMLHDDRVIDVAIRSDVDPASIHDGIARAIIEASINRRAANLPVDVTTISRASGVDWQQIEQCMDLCITSADAQYYANRVRNYAMLDRCAKALANAQSRVAVTAPDDAPEVAEGIVAMIDAAVRQSKPDDDGTIVDAAIDWLDTMTREDSGHVLLDWPVDNITRNLGRLDSEVVWIIAQPSIGKTAFVLQWLLGLAQRGHMVSIASLESSRRAVASRLIAQAGNVNTFPIRQRRANQHEIEAAYAAAGSIPTNLIVADGSMTIDQLIAWGRAEARNGSRLIVIDNTRHIRVQGVERIHAIAEISTRLKQLRDDTDIPVVVLHHSTIDRQSGAENISWSSDVKRDADIVVFLKRDDETSREPMHAGDDGLDIVRFSVDKNREGKSGFDVLMRFRKANQLFEEWSHE